VLVMSAIPDTALPGIALPVVGGLHPFLQPITTLQTLYAIADAVARERGRDPDRPSHLRKVTETW
jgi:glutamine---fructose-6-phosphate transaminase (isomerizing)